MAASNVDFNALDQSDISEISSVDSSDEENGLDVVAPRVLNIVEKESETSSGKGTNNLVLEKEFTRVFLTRKSHQNWILATAGSGSSPVFGRGISQGKSAFYGPSSNVLDANPELFLAKDGILRAEGELPLDPDYFWSNLTKNGRPDNLGATLSCGEKMWLIFKHNFLLRLWDLLKKRWLALIITGLYFAIPGLILIWLGGFVSVENITWVKKFPEHLREDLRLPDLLMDLTPAPREAITALTGLTDIPLIILGPLTYVYMIYYDYVALWTLCLNLMGMQLLFKSFAENLTIMPASYGWDRCLKTVGHSTLEKYEANLGNFSLTGTCAGMIWSGHTLTTILVIYFFMQAFNRTYPDNVCRRRLTRRAGRCCIFRSFPILNTLTAWFIVVWALIIMALLILDHGHYGVDLYLSVLLGAFVLSNDRVMYMIYHANPISAKSVPLAGNLHHKALVRQYRKKRMKAALRAPEV